MFRVLTIMLAGASLLAAPVTVSAQPMRPGGAPSSATLAERLGLFAAPPRGGGWRGQEERAAEGVRRGRLVPLNRVIEQVRRRTPGRLLDAGLEGGARPVYRVRWAADDGRRIDFLVDAESGQVLSAE